MQKLREYQERSISELRQCFKKGKKRVVVVLPTGSGKTSVAAGIAYNAKAYNKKIIFLAHRQELVYQAHTRFAQWGINAGIIMPPHKNYGHTVNIASIQTLIRREHYDADIVFVDECLDGKSLILLPDGTQKTIHSVVSDKIQYIATEIDGEIVPGKVVRWIKNPRNAQKILKIKVKNRHGRFSLLSATANHGIFLREGKKVRADELQVGDAVGYCYRVSAGQGHFIRGDKLSRKSNCGKHGQGNPKWRGGRTVCGAIGKQYYYLTKSGLLDNIDLLSRLSSISVDIIRGYLRQWWSLLPDRLRENRLIMSLSIGRWLETAEQVHHKDEDRLNNYISNLEIMSGSKHSATNGNQYVSRLNSMVFEDAEIVQITEVLNPTSYVYNLEIESTHKYFANGILVANCHHVNSKSYTTILKRYPNAYVIGLTATPFRTDGKALGDIFHDIITPINIKELIDLKYLVPPKYYGHKKDFRYIKTKMGEYDNKELFDAFDKSQLYGEVVSEFKRLGTGKAIVFNVNIVHSSKTCEAFRNAGYSAAHLDHETKDDERKQILSDFASGKYQILCNVSLFTEGYDCLDSQTEILTIGGWKKFNNIGEEEYCFSLNKQTGLIEKTKIESIVIRELNENETMITLKSQHLDIRVTENHEFHFKKRRGYYKNKAYPLSDYFTLKAKNILDDNGKGREYVMPISGISEYSEIDLLDDEIKLLAWFFTDGSFSKKRASLAIVQSESKYHNNIRNILINLKLDFRERLRPPPKGGFKTIYSSYEFTIPKGNHRGKYKRNGWWKLSEFISEEKHIHNKLFLMSARQFEIFWNELLLGDGSLQGGKSGWLWCNKKEQVDAYMQMAITRGYATSYTEIITKNNTKMYRVSCRKNKQFISFDKKDKRAVKIKTEFSPNKEFVWCIKNKNSTIIIRRNGKTAIIGNCPDLNTVILNRATKSKCLFMQMIGRGLRPAEGKENCIVIDHGGNVYEHGMVEDDIVYDIFKKKSKAKKQTPENMADNVKKCEECHALVGTRTITCPYCGYDFPLPEPVETELEEIKTTKIIIPPHLRKRWSEMTDKELEEYRQLKGYKKGWKYHQKKLRTNSFLLSIGKSTGA